MGFIETLTSLPSQATGYVQTTVLPAVSDAYNNTRSWGQAAYEKSCEIGSNLCKYATTSVAESVPGTTQPAAPPPTLVTTVDRETLIVTIKGSTSLPPSEPTISKLVAPKPKELSLRDTFIFLIFDAMARHKNDALLSFFLKIVFDWLSPKN